MGNADYRKHNDRSLNSSKYHKKDGTPVRAILKQELHNMTLDATSPTCNCCGRFPGSVYASQIGPVSYAYCEECLRNNAEPETSFHFLTYISNNDPSQLIPSSLEMKTWRDGAYMTYTEWSAKFGAESLAQSLIDEERRMVDYAQKNGIAEYSDASHANVSDDGIPF